MKVLFTLFTLAGLSFLVSGCKNNDTEPGDFTGRYEVYRSELADFGFKPSTTDGSVTVDVKPGAAADKLILSYGTTNLNLSMTGNTFRIADQGVWVKESDGKSYPASIVGQGVFSNHKITYSYMITYNNIDYEPNGFYMVKARKQ